MEPMKKVMKVFTVVALALYSLCAVAQYVPQAPATNSLFPSAAAGPAGLVTTPGSSLLVNVSPGPVFCSGDMAMIHNVQLGLLANQTYNIIIGCSTNQVFARTGSPGVAPTEVQLATVVTGATAVSTITDNRAAIQFPNEADNYFWLPMNSTLGCSAYLTTGAFAANPANSGALVAPSIARAAANNTVFQVTTTGAASALTLDCNIAIPSKTSTGKGVLVTGINVFYGVQTSNLTSITLPTLSTVTYSATAGGAAAGTVAAAGGTITTTPAIGSAQLTTTTTGLCYQQAVNLTTPIQLNTSNQNLIMEEVFNQTATSAAVYQICGVQVVYQNLPL